MTRYVEIGATKQVRTAIDRALWALFPVCLTSPPGMGKTTALLNGCKEHGYIYMEANESIKSASSLYISLLEAYGSRPDKKYAHELRNILKYKVKRKHYDEPPELLIVDEFQTLPVTLQRELLNIHEHFKVPLVLSGNPERLSSAKKDIRAYEQIRSRLGPIVEVFPPSSKDCEILGREYKLEGIDAYKALAKFGASKSLREICRLLDETRRIRGEGTIQLNYLELGARSVYGSNYRLDQKLKTTNRKGKAA